MNSRITEKPTLGALYYYYTLCVSRRIRKNTRLIAIASMIITSDNFCQTRQNLENY